MIFSTVISLAGIALAYLLYIRGIKILPQGLRAILTPVYRLVSNKYYIDEIYEAVFIKPFLALCNGSFRFDMSIIDGAVNGVAKVMQYFAGLLRTIQSGLVQHYLLVQILGAAIIFFTLFGGVWSRF